MQQSLRRRDIGQWMLRTGALVGVILAGSCSGGSFASSSGTPVVAPTNVTGKSDTSGISAGNALQAVGSTPSPTQ